ncbi:MAG: hypothetical protein ACK2UE_16255 [Anaerolineales bacterium]
MNHSESETTQINTRKSYRLALVLAILAGVNCILVVSLFASYETANFTESFWILWPFPLIYFLEIIGLGLLGVLAVSNLRGESKSTWSGIPWICAGILLAFVILGSWTIGFFLIPAMVLYLVIGIISDKLIQGDIPRHLIYFIAAGIGQALLVFLTLFG